MTNMGHRLIVITGVSRGLGRALAERFVESGHRVVGCGRTPLEECSWNPLRHALLAYHTLDVAEDDQVRVWAKAVLERHGAPDLLVNNAALINKNAPLWRVPAREFEAVVRVNVIGVVNTIRHFVPAMIDHGRGVIVNLTSYWGRTTAPEVAPYCATKWAIEGLTRSLAQEPPKKIAAVALNPGVVDTDMLRSCFGESAKNHADPERWSHAAAPFVLGFGPKDNGKTLTVPGQ
jgi:NAD(P)-dependent dehydrogenase (short-subunit alcohol dehydrogenase family)